jgi:type IV pilus assembly protein PilM
MIKGNFDIQFDFLQTSAPALIGVDISTTSVKMLELSEAPKKTGYIVERYVIEPLPADAVVDGDIKNIDEVSDALRNAWKKLGTRIKNVSLALPAASVTPKTIFLPNNLRESELESQVETEANRYLPFSLDDANLDYQIIGPSAANPEEIEVFLAASRKEQVEDRVASAQAAGLKTVVVDVEPYAAEAAFEQVRTQLPGGGVDQCIALVHIGSSVMNVNVLRNGQSVFMRDLAVGGAQLTQQIQTMYGLSAADAEAAKRNGGLADNYENDLLTPFRDNVAAEIFRVLHTFFSSGTSYSEVTYIVLAGGCAALPGLEDAIATRTQVTTLVANPFASMTLSSRIKPRELQTDAPALMIACGLAMRRFDPS